MSAAIWRARPKRSASKSIRALPRPKSLFENGAVAGIATGDMGIGKDGHHKPGFTRGMELRGKYTLFAEGARGSLSKSADRNASGSAQGREPQKFGIGLEGAVAGRAGQASQRGLVQHTLGWPLDNGTGGGSFLYHFDDNLVAVGFVVHLNYRNPYLSPFEEFQRFKTHPLVARHLRGRQAHQLRRARHHRRRLAIGAEAHLSRRRADRLRGRLRQRAAHQGQPQRHAVRHAGGRARRRGARAGPRQRRARRATKRRGARRRSAAICGGCATPSRYGRSSAPSPASRSAGSTCGPTRSASRCSARSSTASPISRRSSPRRNAGRIAYRQAGRQAHLRPAVLGLSVEHQSRGRPAGAPSGARPGVAEIVRARRLCRAVGALLPGRRL